MAESRSSPDSSVAQPETYESDKQDLQSTQPDQSQPTPAPSSSSPLVSSSLPPTYSSVTSAHPVAETPDSNPHLVTPLPPSVQSFAPSSIAPGVVPPSAPSFRPVTPVPQFSPLTNYSFQSPNIQNPNVQPPGVSPVSIMLPGAASGVGSVMVSVSPFGPAGVYQAPPGQPPNVAMRPMYPHMSNGFLTTPSTTPQGTVHPPGIPRFPVPYPAMIRPAFPPRPPGAVGVFPPLSRPPVPGVRPPIVPPVLRPVVSILPPTEKPQTTVYVGKIASTVENEFMLSLLRLCGPVKSWKRAQDPSDGTPRGFGFCEFESAEGVLRALRQLSKFNVDGQELVLNVNQATREYLERYVEKKTEREKKPKETEKEEESQPGSEKNEPESTSEKGSNKDESDSADKENQDNSTFGIVTDEDREADRDALEKLTSMIEERLKTKPPPPPPAPTTADSSAKSNSELLSKSRDGDSDVDIMKDDAAEDKNDDETTSERKPTNVHDKPEISSPDRNRRYDKHSRDRDRGRDLKREKEWELERYEREKERERVRRERDREMKIREAERLYKERVKEWEARERDKEYQRQHEKEREKEREWEHRREIMDQEDESDDDDTRKRRRRSSVYEEKRKKRQREKEEDLADRLREDEEIAEAKRRAIEEQQMQTDELKVEVANGVDGSIFPEKGIVEQACEDDSLHVNHAEDMILGNGIADEATMVPVAVSDMRQSSNAPARKLGFGLVGSGKRTTVPSVFHEEDDDDAEKEKKMRPLVPLDYSIEEIQVVQPAVSGAPSSNLAAAAEFAKRISNSNPKEERSDADRDRSRRSTDKLSHRDRDRNDEDNYNARDENKEKKLLDAKQLIDMIPKTKEELFLYEINWAVYDKHELHERMRPWIAKKITEFLGEEEETLVDYVVSSTKQHVQASQMLELLQSILDDEAEMFVLKMWRMLIFEIKKVEMGLSLKPRA
ncbi:hypothetical protein NE237_007230 [Protea cynaroides]|uniref:RNA-binding protein 25 n=1 Tax=Protea cynaroides TaxID=273540 RepID=A0A9Q0KPM3_9MAGN|nr:hypothetical protein NE237_007230 [Protea cynaroides]